VVLFIFARLRLSVSKKGVCELVRKFVASLLVVVSIVGASACSVESVESGPVESRPRNETVFLDVIRDHGIKNLTDEQAINNAKNVCRRLDDGQNALDIAYDGIPGQDFENSAILVGAAIGAFCPEHIGK